VSARSVELWAFWSQELSDYSEINEVRFVCRTCVDEKLDEEGDKSRSQTHNYSLDYCSLHLDHRWKFQYK